MKSKILFFYFFLIAFHSNAQTNFTDKVSPFCSGNYKNYFLTKNIKYPEKIIVDIKQKKKWRKNLINLYVYQKKKSEQQKKLIRFQNVSSSGDLKKYFKAKIIVFYTNNIKCKFNGKVRVHGGNLNDHFDGDFIKKIYNVNDQPFVSLRIKLFNGHINHSRDFALFLPSSRNGEDEIFSSVLYKSLGFISPETFYLKTSINKKEKNLIFQDRGALSILQSNKRRPGPILSENRRREFPEIALSRYRGFNDILSSKDVALSHFLDASDKYNFIKLNISNPKVRQKVLKQEEYSLLALFYIISISSGNMHGLDVGDKRFYYNIYKEIFEPIYYDGSSDLLNSIKTNQFNKEFVLSNLYNIEEYDFLKFSNLHAIQLIRSLDNADFQQELFARGLYLEKDIIQKYFNILVDRIRQLRSLDKENIKFEMNDNFPFYNVIHKYNRHFKLVFYNKKNIFEVCNVDLLFCKKKKFSKVDIEKLFSYQIAKIGAYNYRFIRKKKNHYVQNIYKKKQTYEKFTAKGINILYHGLSINYDEKQKKIIFTGKNKNNLALIYNSNLNNLDILSNDSCLIIQDSKLKNINIFSKTKNSTCKNTTHIISSSGSVSNIIQRGKSNEDAVDFDLSNLSVNNIEIEGASNDCLGIKSGDYKFRNILIKNCDDKSLSIGDDSFAQINKVYIQNNIKKNNAKAEIVVKNSSIADIKNVKIYTNNICIAAYRKSNFYHGSKIILDKKNYFCSGKGYYEHGDSIVSLK